ncbi:S-formylglutathione hydrolase [Alphaproteobacteria bacterium]|nr:S-formylglutathione hydrolase [Alphaproteobacteria bacterium]
MDIISENVSHGGVQGVYKHVAKITQCEMTFAVFMPPSKKTSSPVLWYLSGLTCNHSNVMEKGGYRRLAAELGIAIVCPDTSPRGEGVPDEKDNWQFGLGAGFYLDATELPFSVNYNMSSYILDELTELIDDKFDVDMNRQGIFGHSMGGHGALTMALKNPKRFRSCSAFAPISQPTTADWSMPAFQKYLGQKSDEWRKYDAVSLIEDGNFFPKLFVDQGEADSFLEEGLRPWLLVEACEKAGIEIELRMHKHYDHSYFFISTFMEDHLRWHFSHL